MKDEHQVRIAALELTKMIGGLTSQTARIEIAAVFEHYILNGHAGEAQPTPKARDEVPGADGEDRPKRRATGRKSGSGKAGEASELESEGEIDLSELGRPSTRVSGVSV